MRIITGKYRGRNLTTLKDLSVRPATDRVKGTIYNVLQNRLDLRGARVLDLFAGSGNLGFEAVSRGAACAVFVEDNGNAARMIEKNAMMLGCKSECDIVTTDALTFLATSRTEPFDLIFADPPYAYEQTPEIPNLVMGGKLLHTDGFLIIEHTRRTLFPHSDRFVIAVRKEFGNTAVSFFQHSTTL